MRLVGPCRQRCEPTALVLALLACSPFVAGPTSMAGRGLLRRSWCRWWPTETCGCRTTCVDPAAVRGEAPHPGDAIPPGPAQTCEHRVRHPALAVHGRGGRPRPILSLDGVRIAPARALVMLCADRALVVDVCRRLGCRQARTARRRSRSSAAAPVYGRARIWSPTLRAFLVRLALAAGAGGRRNPRWTVGWASVGPGLAREPLARMPLSSPAARRRARELLIRSEASGSATHGGSRAGGVGTGALVVWAPRSRCAASSCLAEAVRSACSSRRAPGTCAGSTSRSSLAVQLARGSAVGPGSPSASGAGVAGRRPQVGHGRPPRRGEPLARHGPAVARWRPLRLRLCEDWWGRDTSGARRLTSLTPFAGGWPSCSRARGQRRAPRSPWGWRVAASSWRAPTSPYRDLSLLLFGTPDPGARPEQARPPSAGSTAGGRSLREAGLHVLGRTGWADR